MEIVGSRAQAPDDPFAIHKGLGTAERDEGNFWRARGVGKARGGRWSSACWLGIHAPAWHARCRLASGDSGANKPGFWAPCYCPVGLKYQGVRDAYTDKSGL